MFQKHTKTIKNLKFLLRRHHLTGFDSDYLEKLSSEEALWLEQFARRYYDGEDPDPERKKESNHRRYMAKSGDAHRIAIPIQDVPADDRPDIDPETILMTFEDQ
jgi:hypothetical protein